MTTKAGTARKTAPKPAPKPVEGSIGIGTTVLFRLDVNVQRPLVISEMTEGGVRGTIFTNGEDDNGALWITKNLFHRPSVEERNWLVYLKEPAVRGDGIGEWQPK